MSPGPGDQRGGRAMTPRPIADEAVDSAAIQAFAAHYGERAAHLPPVAIVIAAFNEEAVLGSVVHGLPASLCGLAASVIVVSDGARDATVAEGRAHGALV